MMTEQLDEARDLVLERWIAASPEALYRCWTESELLMRWFAPQPWRTLSAELDVRVGGTSLVVMGGPNGEQIPCPGIYLALEPGRRIVSTDAYERAWQPTARPFMTLILSFTPEGEGTRYRAWVRHWSEADRKEHEAMGFHSGWGQCTDQLAELAATL